MKRRGASPSQSNVTHLRVERVGVGLAIWQGIYFWGIVSMSISLHGYSEPIWPSSISPCSWHSDVKGNKRLAGSVVTH